MQSGQTPPVPAWSLPMASEVPSLPPSPCTFSVRCLWVAVDKRNSGALSFPQRPDRSPRHCAPSHPLGWRIGKGEGYADLEYAMMVSMGAVHEGTPVVTIVHDCQVRPADVSLSAAPGVGVGRHLLLLMGAIRGVAMLCPVPAGTCGPCCNLTVSSLPCPGR